MGLVLVTPPAVEPIALQEAKDHVVIDAASDDSIVEALITTARQACEEATNRALIEQTWRYTRRCFPPADCPMELPKPPLRSVTSIQYVDDAGTLQTLSSSLYVVDTDGEDGVVGHVRPVYGGEWPITRDEPNAVRVTFVAGYGGSEDIPLTLRHGMLELISEMYTHREAFFTGTIGNSVPGAGASRFMAHAVLWRNF